MIYRIIVAALLAASTPGQAAYVIDFNSPAQPASRKNPLTAAWPGYGLTSARHGSINFFEAPFTNGVGVVDWSWGGCVDKCMYIGSEGYGVTLASLSRSGTISLGYVDIANTDNDIYIAIWNKGNFSFEAGLSEGAGADEIRRIKQEEAEQHRIHLNVRNVQAVMLGGRMTNFFVDAISVVPEPATWLMMVGGMGLVGSSLRARPKRGSIWAPV